MNRKLQTFCVLLLVVYASSCGNPIEPNRRIAFEVTVEDSSGNGLSGIDTNIGMYSTPFLFLRERFLGLTGVGATDDQGNARIISLKPQRTGTDVVALLINADDPNNDVVNPDYGSVILRVDTVENNQLSFPSITLRRIAELTITAVNTSATTDELVIRVDVENRDQLFSFPDDMDEDLTSSNVLSITRSIDATQGIEGFSSTLRTLQNTTGIFTYFFRNENSETAPITIEIPINESITTYVFEY